MELEQKITRRKKGELGIGMKEKGLCRKGNDETRMYRTFVASNVLEVIGEN